VNPYGAIFRAEASRTANVLPVDGDSYACLLAFYRYRIDLDPHRSVDVRACLDAATTAHPDNATAWALSAQLAVDEVRFLVTPPAAVQASLARARDEARRAAMLDPENMRALQAEMLARFFQGDVDGALEVGRRAMGFRAHDAEFSGEYGFRLALSGQWGDGCALVESAKDQLMGPVGYYESALAVCAYMVGSNKDAVAWVKKAEFTANPQYHLIAAYVFAEAGMAEDASREAQWLRQNTPEFVRNLPNEIKLRLRRPEDRERVMRSIAKTGLLAGSTQQ
jgi:hypothetical protein